MLNPPISYRYNLLMSYFQVNYIIIIYVFYTCYFESGECFMEMTHSDYLRIRFKRRIRKRKTYHLPVNNALRLIFCLDFNQMCPVQLISIQYECIILIQSYCIYPFRKFSLCYFNKWFIIQCRLMHSKVRNESQQCHVHVSAMQDGFCLKNLIELKVLQKKNIIKSNIYRFYS